MPKRTLLDMTQRILSDMDSDTVNSISDTTESAQVANIIETIYYDLIANKSIPEHRELVQFEALSNSAKPNYLQYPATMTQIEWFKYDKRDSAVDTKVNYDTVDYLFPTEFIEMVNNRDSSATNVTSVTDSSGITLLIKNDTNPAYWTSFDDDYVVCDSYDSAIDTTLQKSKTQAYGKVEPTFTQSDTFIPDIDVDLFPLLFSTAKAACFIDLKQQNSAVASAASRNHIVRQQNNRHRYNKANGAYYENYGRK